MSPVEHIENWIKDKPSWWQHSMRLSLKNGALSSADLKEIYQVALVESDILKNEEISLLFSQPIDIAGFGSEVSEVTLKCIEQVNNVGALAEDQKLEFIKKGLTIIYGDNGTGKSSYAKILKHACLSRGGSPVILGNVFSSSLTPSSATITVTTDGIEDIKHWNLGFIGDSNLKSIRIFDGDVADHFVTGEDELGYKPTGLHILEELAEAVNYVNRQVSEEIMGSNGFTELPEFGNTSTGLFISKISSSTDLSEVSGYVASEEELNNLGNLYKEIYDLKSMSPEKLRRGISDKKRQLEPLKNFMSSSMAIVSNEAFDFLKIKEKDYLDKKKLAEEIEGSVLLGMPIPGVGGELWQRMWAAAEKYLISAGEKVSFPPKENESCPLCLQKINENSANKMSDFSLFMASEAFKDASESQSLLGVHKKEISDYSFSVAPYEAAIALAEENLVGFSTAMSNLVLELEGRKATFTADSLPSSVINGIPGEGLDNITTLLSELDYLLLETSDDEKYSSLIERKEKIYCEILDKKLFKDNLTSIKSNINRYKLVAKYNNLKVQCKLRPITDENSEICKQEVVAPLVVAFENELKKFGFNRFKVIPKTRGKSGAQLLKLEILSSGEPLVSKVASEGEQRCIAISCFLAEMSADKRKSAVIFDDPVNSLSHQWSHRVAKRLVEESLHRQVVVLTHDIVFYKLLLEEVENTGVASLHQISLERNRKNAGIVRTTPPWDALTTGKRIKQLNIKLRDLRSVDEGGTISEFRSAAYIFYGYLREAWERLVEEKLLNQVVTRFGRSVQTARLRKLIDLTEEDFDRIDAAMRKCSTYFRGHDSAVAIGDPYPTIQEIEEDLAEIKIFNNELQNARKRS